MPTAYTKMVLRYAPFALLTTGLAGCAPAYVPEPIYSAPPPQAMPLPPVQANPYIPPAQPPMPVPVQQPPRRVNNPPTVTPIEARTKIVAEPLPELEPVRKPSGPAVSYIPEKPASPSNSQNSKPTQTRPASTPFWDQGKVQVEVLDLKPEKTTAPTSSSISTQTSTTSVTPPSTGVSSSMSQTSSSPVVAVLLKQANNELSVGKADRAAATLERALRIAPDDANLWLRLAEVNEQLGNKGQATTMARKALDLAPNDAAIRLRAQRLAN